MHIGSIFWMIVIGIIAGWLSGKIMKGSGFGLLGDLAIGILGSIIGGVLFSAVGLSADGKLGSLIVSTVGALVLLFAVKQIRKST